MWAFFQEMSDEIKIDFFIRGVGFVCFKFALYLNARPCKYFLIIDLKRRYILYLD
jgi:hypothetical protein